MCNCKVCEDNNISIEDKIKVFLKLWVCLLKDMGTDEHSYYKIVLDNLSTLTEHYINLLKKDFFDSHMDIFSTILSSFNFGKALYKVVKDKGFIIDKNLVGIVNHIIEHCNIEHHSPLGVIFNDILYFLNLKLSKILSNKAPGVPISYITDLITTIYKTATFYYNSSRLLNRAIIQHFYYRYTKHSIEIEAVINGLNDMGIIKLKYFVADILLEREYYSYLILRKGTWINLNEFALTFLNTHDDGPESLGYYCYRRTEDNVYKNDSARRINFMAIDKDEYPNIANIVSKLKEQYPIRFLS